MLACKIDACHSLLCLRRQEVLAASEEDVNGSSISSNKIICSQGNFVPSAHYLEDTACFKFAKAVFSLLSRGMRKVRLLGSIQSCPFS